jgi:phosphogluconate dehydratase
VALLTDGRMSGASGKVPAVIHVSPEALGGGPLGRVRDGDIVRLDAERGRADALVPEAEWAARAAHPPAPPPDPLGDSLGRSLFAAARAAAASAEQGGGFLG